MSRTPETPAQHFRRKLKQLNQEALRKDEELDWHNLAHLSRDMNAKATNQEILTRHRKPK